MKKLLLVLGITSLVGLSANTAFADCGFKKDPCNPCQKPKVDCECPNKPDCGCKKDKCKEDKCKKAESCHDMAQRSDGDCYEKKREELYCRLNLDRCQRQEAKKIEDCYRDTIENEKETLKADHKCLCEKIQAPCLDKQAVREQERIVKNDIKQIKRTMKDVDKEFKQILQCDQKSEYRKIKREMKYRIKKGMKYCCKPCHCK